MESKKKSKQYEQNSRRFTDPEKALAVTMGKGLGLVGEGDKGMQKFSIIIQASHRL